MLHARVFLRILALLLPFWAATCLLLLQNSPLLPLANSTVLINEVDSETPGTDTAEFVELYDGGSGNTTLDGLLVVFFNGQDDRSYRTIDLTGYQTSPQGYFLLGNESLSGIDLAFPDNLLQNGPDAVALYLAPASDFPNGTAVTTSGLQDALVYDANDADDPGLLLLLEPGEPQVDENGRDLAEFHSNQRCPNGGGGARRTTSYTQALPTPRLPNDCPAVLDQAPQVQSTSPAAGAIDVALDANLSITFSEEVALAGGWYSLDCSLSGEHTAAVSGNGITFTLNPALNFTYAEECTVTLSADLINDLDSQDPPDHMPEDYTFSFRTEEPPLASHVIINELDADTPGTDTAEFIELYDGGRGSTTLDNLTVVLFNGSDDRSYRAIDLTGQMTDGQGYLVIGSAGVKNVGLVIPDGTIQNGADAAALYHGRGSDFPNGTDLTTLNLLDAIVYDTDDADDTGLLPLLNQGQPQVNENSRANAPSDSSQRCPNGSGGQRSTETFLQNLATPGAANKCTFDNPPWVASTWPANGQQNIGQAISLTVTFSEAVEAAGGAFELSCSASGAHDLTVSGGPVQFTIKPSPNLAAGERCTAAVTAASVSDQDTDDPPDHMAKDYTWTFDVQELPVATHILINEVDADSPGTDTAEFIELFDGGSGRTRLDGLVLVLFNGNGDLSYRSIDLDGFSTGTAGYFTVGGSEVPGIDLALPSGIIQNGADAVALYAANGADFPNGSPVTQDGLLDALVYDTHDEDDPGLLSLLLAGQPQVDEAARNDQEYDSNQRCPNGQGGQRATAGFIQNPATPGAANNCTADKAPQVIETTPSAGAEDVALDASLTISFSEAVTVSESWFEIRCSRSLVHTAAQAGGPIEYTLNPQEDFEAGESCLVTLFAGQITDQDGLPQPLAADFNWVFTTGPPAFGACADAATPVHIVQGSGTASPLEGIEVVLEGVVGAAFQGASALDGFYLQEEIEDQDTLSQTSEGIFVYDMGLWSGVTAGEIIRAQGTVREIAGQTSLTQLAALRRCGFSSVPAPSPVDLPLPSPLAWENYEGMSITLPQDLSVTGNDDLGSEGSIDLAWQSRLFAPTEIANPGEPALALARQNDRSRIKLDDGRSQTLPSPPYLGPGVTLRVGDKTSGVTGILAESTDGYRIHPTEPVAFLRANTRPSLVTASRQTVRVALFDLGGYFNGDGQGAGFPTQGGAASEEEFIRQRTKIINALLALDAHVVALLSLENDGFGPHSAIQDLVNGLNDQAPGEIQYALINPTISEQGEGSTAVGLIYRPDMILPQGPALVLDQAPFEAAAIRPLVQAFTTIADQEEWVLAVAHFKDRGACPAQGDPNADQSDGQDCWNSWRVHAAETLAETLTADPLGTTDAPILILGNLNTYSLEDPLRTLSSAGYVDLVNRSITHGYTAVTNGESGSLLHAVGSANAASSVAQIQQWHINADEPQVFDYRLANPPFLYSPDAYRSAEYDPIVIDLYSQSVIRIFLPLIVRGLAE